MTNQIHVVICLITLLRCITRKFDFCWNLNKQDILEYDKVRFV